MKHLHFDPLLHLSFHVTTPHLFKACFSLYSSVNATDEGLRGRNILCYWIYATSCAQKSVPVISARSNESLQYQSVPPAVRCSYSEAWTSIDTLCMALSFSTTNSLQISCHLCPPSHTHKLFTCRSSHVELLTQAQ